MPTFHSHTTSRSGSLSLNADHHLVAGSTSEPSRTIPARLLHQVDVLLAPDFVLAISGTLNHVSVSSQAMLKSAVVLHLLRYLKTNASELGLGSSSDVYLDSDDNRPKITLTASNSVVYNPRRPQITLTSIDLTYDWKIPLLTSCDSQCSEDGSPVLRSDPFSSSILLLPFESTLDSAVETFVSAHLVKRYPMIFGPWRKKLDNEKTFFDPIASSILNIVERSSDNSFRTKCRKILKKIESNLASSFLSAFSDLSMDDETHRDDYSATEKSLADGRTITDSLEMLYRIGIPRPRFYSLAGKRPLESDGDNELDLDLLQDAPVLGSTSPASHQLFGNLHGSDCIFQDVDCEDSSLVLDDFWLDALQFPEPEDAQNSPGSEAEDELNDFTPESHHTNLPKALSTFASIAYAESQGLSLCYGDGDLGDKDDIAIRDPTVDRNQIWSELHGGSQECADIVYENYALHENGPPGVDVASGETTEELELQCALDDDSDLDMDTRDESDLDSDILCDFEILTPHVTLDSHRVVVLRNEIPFRPRGEDQPFDQSALIAHCLDELCYDTDILKPSNSVEQDWGCGVCEEAILEFE